MKGPVGDNPEGPTKRTQYDKLANDWRHINTIIWGIPAVAVTIMAGIIVAAYSKELDGWPRIVLLGVGALFLFALTVEIVKKRLLMNAISARLQYLERDPKIEFPSSTDDLISYVKENIEKNPDRRDPVYRLFVRSYARQYLAVVIFIAAILISILTVWEFINFFPYKQWAIPMAITPIAIVCVIIAVFKISDYRQYKRNKKTHKL